MRVHGQVVGGDEGLVHPFVGESVGVLLRLGEFQLHNAVPTSGTDVK